MKIKKIILIAVSIIFIGLIQAQANKELILRVSQVPPKYYKDSKGEWTGRDFSIAQKIITNAGYTLKPRKLPFKRALSELKRGHNLDIVMSLTPNQNRSKHFSWIGPYDYKEISLIVKEEDKNLPIRTIKDLMLQVENSKYERKIGLQRGFMLTNRKFMKIAKNRKYVYQYSRPEKGGIMVQKGKLLGFIGLHTISQYQIDNQLNHMKGLTVHSFTLNRIPKYLGISKKIDPKIYKNLSKSFDELKKTNAFDEIKEKKWKPPTHKF